MSTIDLKEFEQEFVIHFGCDQRRINAYTLAATLVSLADAVKEANTIVNPGYEVEVVVEAIGPGSFRAKVRTIYKGLENLFSKENLKAIAIGVVSAYVYQVTLAPDVKINVVVDDEHVIIEQGNQRVIIPKETHEALKQVEKSEKFKSSVGKMFDVAEKDPEITSLGITKGLDDEEPLISIPRSRFALAARLEESEEDSREITELTELQIIRAILDRSKRRWEFSWRGIRIPAPVFDEKFYDDFFAHRITIAPGDSLEVKLRVYQRKDPDTGIFTNERYEVIEVIKHLPRLRQLGASL